MNYSQYQKLISKKGYDEREHQCHFLTSGEFESSILPYVLAAGTSSGKGPMAVMKLEDFYSNPKNKNKCSVFISASKTVLRDNIHAVLKKFKPSFSYSIVKDKKTLLAALDRKAQVLVFIPQTIKNKNYYKLLPKIEMFILDEAHEWYFAKTKGNKQSVLSKILKHTQPKKQLLLTGTPSKFVAKANNFNFQFVPVMDLYDQGLVSNVKMEIVSSTYDFKANDWLGTYGNLKLNKTNSPKKAEDALYEVCKEMIDKLKNPLKDWYNINNITKNSFGKLFKYLDKTIIYTHSKVQADKFYKILNGKKELNGHVLLSHSENDKDSIEFNKFKTDENYHILIAVDRGRIGFDMPELFNIVDFTMTQNLDTLLQMYGRLLRKSDLQKKKQKIYFKVATKNTADYFVDLMTAMLCLTTHEWYCKFNGKNMGGIHIPKVLTKSIRNKNYQQSQKKTKSNKVKPYVSITELGIPLDLNFFRQSILHSSNGKFNTIAETTLDDVRREMFEIKKYKLWTKEEIINSAKQYKTKNEWNVNQPSTYVYARKYGWFDEAIKHMDVKKRSYTKEDVINEAKKYKKRQEFRKHNRAAFDWAYKLNIVDEAFKHMPKSKRYTIDEAIKEAKKYTSYKEFYSKSRWAQRKLYDNNLLEKHTKHMIKMINGYK
jgi:superfamily II DNA/RNA helicase